MFVLALQLGELACVGWNKTKSIIYLLMNKKLSDKPFRGIEGQGDIVNPQSAKYNFQFGEMSSQRRQTLNIILMNNDKVQLVESVSGFLLSNRRV